MKIRTPGRLRAHAFPLLLLLLLPGCAGASPRTGVQTPSPAASAGAAAAERTPSETLRAFLQALRGKRFREAFALSIYQPAVEGLSAEEFEELRPEFEKLAAALAAEQLEISGEQISGETATVFVKMGQQTESVPFIRLGGAWTFGDRGNYEAVRREGREFFLKARVETHHQEVRNLLLKLANAEALYASQHGGQYADLDALVRSKPGLREEMEAAATLGYSFRISLGKDGRSYKLNAEPTRYGRTGRLSFYMDAGGMQEKDTGGKPFNPSRK